LFIVLNCFGLKLFLKIYLFVKLVFFSQFSLHNSAWIATANAKRQLLLWWWLLQLGLVIILVVGILFGRKW